MTVDDFFAGRVGSRLIFEAVRRVVDTIGPAKIHVSKSQVAFRRRINFAMMWMPGQYLRRKAAPLVLVLSFRFRDPSPRWKSIVEPSPGRFTHHLELYSADDVDGEVAGWIRDAWMAAG